MGLNGVPSGSAQVRKMRASYALKAGERPTGSDSPGGTYDGTFGADWEYVEGSGDLDECNGREGPVEIGGETVVTYHYVLTDTFPFIPRCWRAAPDDSFSMGGGPGDAATGGGATGGGAPGACAEGQTSMCCGDGVCDGPETADTCPADCG